MAAVLGSNLKVAGPLGNRLDGYDRAQPPSKQKSGKRDVSTDDDIHIFVDAMKVREEVFVHEQQVPLENEFDDDDPYCVHITIYESQPGTNEPCGTIRIVPATSAMHQHLDKHRTIEGKSYEGPIRSSIHDGKEPFIKLGRLAVITSRRGYGYAAVLVRGALEYARSHPDRVAADNRQRSDSASEATQTSNWNGLVLIHAQQQVQRFWARHGFELDENIGIWDEEGIDHVAMWRRLSLE